MGLATCRVVAQHDGVLIGPSTGMAIFAGLKAADMDSSIQRVGLIGSDDGRAYMSSIMEEFNPSLDQPLPLQAKVHESVLQTIIPKRQHPKRAPPDGRASAHECGTDPPVESDAQSKVKLTLSLSPRSNDSNSLAENKPMKAIKQSM